MSIQDRIPKPEGDKPKECQNCGYLGSGSYCSNCGQGFSELNRPIRKIISELFDVFDLDHRIFRSIVPFLFKPGFLAREYLLGRRKKFISPFRLYLLLSLVFFFLAQYTSKRVLGDGESNWVHINNDSTNAIITNDSLAIELLRNDSNFKSISDSNNTSTSIINDRMIKRLRASAVEALTNKEIFLSNFYESISYILFLLMPIFALLLKLLYVRRRVYYIEHLIFSINIHSFAILIFTLMIIINQLVGENNGLTPLMLLIIPVYFTAGMKRFYQQAYWKIIVKEFILALLYSIILIITLFIAGFFTLYFL